MRRLQDVNLSSDRNSFLHEVAAMVARVCEEVGAAKLSWLTVAGIRGRTRPGAGLGLRLRLRLPDVSLRGHPDDQRAELSDCVRGDVRE